MIDILLVVHIVLAVLLVIVILMQKSGTDGLGGLAGGGGGGGLVTARAAANFLTRMTVVLAALFMINAIVLANLSGGKKEKVSDVLEKELEGSAVPMAK